MDETLAVGVLPGPVSNWRSNKPHPTGDFLSPKSLNDDDSHVVQIKVEEASRRYLDNLGYSQTNPPTKLLHNVLKASQKLSHEAPPKQDVPLQGPSKTTSKGASDFIQESLKLLETSRKGDRGELKRERGNSYRVAAKDYATTPIPPRSGKPTLSASNGRSSKLLNSSGSQLVQNMKRGHSTTPPGTSTGSPRPRSVTYEAQRVAQKKAMRIPTSADETKITDQLKISTNGSLDTEQVGIEETRPMTAADLSTYSPRMKSWVEGANEYEREVAFNLFNSLRTDKGGLRKGSMLPDATGVYVAGGKSNRNTREDQVVQQMMKLLGDDVDRQSNMPNVYQKQSNSARPQYRQMRRAPSFDGYMHLGSQFQQTRAPFRKSFDIAPDWCSEGKTYRRLIRKAAQNKSV
ncbi:uncharacterized protein [Apostichopus japonicus]|uniref:uncharacterized protein isoform X2 n=1 Tax=Stichopus japonicus TaxID=307972 RepID=UPI003AB31FC0